MKKYLVLTTLALTLFLASFAQDSIPYSPAPSFTQKIDSLQMQLNKQHDLVVAFAHATGNDRDTIATPSQVVSDISTLASQWSTLTTPKKVLAIIGILLAVFFAFTEYNLKPVLRAIDFLGFFHKKKPVLPLLLLPLLFLGSCSILSHSYSPSGGQVTEALGKKGITATEFVAVHTNIGQNDTAGLVMSAPDSLSNKLIAKAHAFIQVNWPGHTLASSQQSLGNSWYVMEDIRLHSGIGLRDTASFVFYGSDSITNAVFNKFEAFVIKQ